MFGPALVALTIFSFVWLGYEMAHRLPARRTGFEAACVALLIGASLWIGSVWLAALLHRLDAPTMLLRSIAVIVAAAMLLLPRLRHLRGASSITIENRTAVTWVVPMLPLALWIGFVLWRSCIVPPLSHDALAYHLPRAVFWIREHGFGPITSAVDFRMRTLPANYEMLLADVILLAGGDAYVEWIAIFFFVAFLVSCGALAQRWWSDDPRAAFVVVLVAASVPVLLLHAGADKNDTMTGFFMVAALVVAGRWLTEGDRASLVLCGIALFAAIGTKPQGLMLAACLFPFVAARLVRELRSGEMTLRRLAGVLVISLVAATLLGGAFYVAKGLGAVTLEKGASDRQQFVAYDDWANVWQAPWILLSAPFAPRNDELYVPWSDHAWFWRRNEIYFSHLGIPFAISVFLLPFAIAAFRRDSPERARERRAISIASLGTLLLMLPVRDIPMPHGIYVTALPRYVLFLVPVVFGLTVAPAFLRWMPETSMRSRIVLYALAALLLGEATRAALNDRFVPWEYVMFARQHPGLRVIAFDPNRAASVADRKAGEHETIAFDAGYAAWIHPAFGASLQRPVEFIAPGAGAPQIPDDAKWVVIDRSFRVIWQHPDFHDTSQWQTYLAHGSPSAEDTRVLRALARDPRFRLVFFNRWQNQAVFERIGN